MPDFGPLLEIVQLAILFFLVISIFGFFLLAVIRKAIDRYFHKMEHEKKRWIPVIDELLKASEAFRVSSRPETFREKTGFALALTEYTVNDPVRYRQFCRIVGQYSIDATLANLYRKNFFPFLKTFYLSTLADMPCSQQTPLYLDLIYKNSSERIYVTALYGLSKTIANAQEALGFFYLFKGAMEKFHLSQKYCELLTNIILRHLIPSEIGRLIESLRSEDSIIAWCIAQSLGRFRRPDMQAHLRKIYRKFQQDPEIVAALVRSLFMLRVQVCDLTEELLEREEAPIRINLAKFGLDLCDTPDMLVKMVKYFFDNDYYVRQNIYQSFLRHNVPSERILDIVHRHYPQKSDDSFFKDMMQFYRGEEETRDD
jgi:hypothetical protein